MATSESGSLASRSREWAAERPSAEAPAVVEDRLVPPDPCRVKNKTSAAAAAASTTIPTAQNRLTHTTGTCSSGSGLSSSLSRTVPPAPVAFTQPVRHRPTLATGTDYDSYAYQGVSGWLVFGGTSASSPFVGAAIAVASTWASYGTSGADHLYANAGSFSDVSGRSSGSCVGPLCNAGTGWDGPTGLGSVNGTAGL